MSRLKVKHHGKILQEIVLNPEKVYAAGRKEDCDIPLLMEKTISREHFRLVYQQPHWQLEVLSRFGDVLFQNEKVQNLVFTESNVFHIPPYEFEFFVEAEPNAKALTTGSSLVGGEYESNEDRTYVGKFEQVPFIKVVGHNNQPPQLFRLEGGEVWLAGRDSSSAIPIKDQRVSRRQFEIRKTESGYGIIDLGSVNGTLLNGNNISSSELTPLRSGDAITVLDNNLYFELHDPQFMQRVQNVDYDKVSRALVESTPPDQPLSENYPVVDPNVYGQDPYANYTPPADLPPARVENFVDKLKAKKLQVIIAVLALVAVIGLLSEGDKSSKGGAGLTDARGNPNDPFNKLKKEQQTLIKQSFQLAQSYYESDNSELCRTELSKIRDIMPEYKKSYWAKDIDNLDQSAEQKIFLITKQKEFEAKEKMLAEQETKIQEIAADCKKKLTPQTSRDEFENCISPTVTLNPNHPLLEALRAEFSQIEMQRLQQSQQQKEFQEQADRLQRLYAQAEKIDKNESITEAIEAYRKVVNSKLADPKSLKSKAQRTLSSLKSQVGSKTTNLIAEADKLAQAKNYKQAILNLRTARKVNPMADELNDKIDGYIKELKKEMKSLWDEAIIEESFGKVMPDENNSGAVGKWKKIIEQDIPDGDFYQKAIVKLKKYGAN